MDQIEIVQESVPEGTDQQDNTKRRKAEVDAHTRLLRLRKRLQERAEKERTFWNYYKMQIMHTIIAFVLAGIVCSIAVQYPDEAYTIVGVGLTLVAGYLVCMCSYHKSTSHPKLYKWIKHTEEEEEDQERVASFRAHQSAETVESTSQTEQFQTESGGYGTFEIQKSEAGNDDSSSQEGRVAIQSHVEKAMVHKSQSI